MALSNKFGEMLVTTGNKSEMSVGYATLYGDMCGGYSVLKDVYKTEVYRALRAGATQQRPEGALGPAGRVIPERVITKAPTAELRPEPDRPGLAAALRRCSTRILHGLVEEELSVDEIVARGFDARHGRARAAPALRSPNTSAARRRRA